jgi:hypothetical protein
MKTGKEVYDQSLLDSLEKNYQLFLESPNGEINVYLVLSKFDEDKDSDFNMLNNYRNSNSLNNNFNNGNVLKQNKSYKNLPSGFNEIMINNFS